MSALLFTIGISSVLIAGMTELIRSIYDGTFFLLRI